jgi:DNA-directed RNA polymerase specialized sigma24 family protein
VAAVRVSSRHSELVVGTVLAELHRDLVRIARGALFTHGLDVQEAEDLVSEATIRWLGKPLHVQLTQAALRAWFRTTITRLAVDRVRRPGRDILDLAGLYSLDAPWATRTID